MMHSQKDGSLLLKGLMCVSFFGMIGCKQEIPETGGVIDQTDVNAPKVIQSDKLVSFTSEFYLYGYDRPGSEYDRKYRFDVSPDENGKLILSEQYNGKISCEVDDTFLLDLQKIITKYDLVKLNGIDRYTAGLPPEFQPSFLSADYESGEHLYFRIKNEPDAKWAKEVLDLCIDEFAAHGNKTLLIPKQSESEVFEGVILKEKPEEGDLIKGETFFARMPKNRYGSNCKEGDYAEGKFIIWLNRVTLSDQGEITGREDDAIPYIVNEDRGNQEHLSMLSGGVDGDYPYGVDVWKITTDEEGTIVDAVFYE